MAANHTARLYALALSLSAFFLAWAVVAARPWAPTKADPRLHTLSVRAAELRREAKLVNEIVALRAKASTSTPAPSLASVPAVRVVNLPPVTITRTS
ncbi:MAG: hypothetical protein ACRDL2_04020 [Gaiellaceae bacterium]